MDCSDCFDFHCVRKTYLQHLNKLMLFKLTHKSAPGKETAKL